VSFIVISKPPAAIFWKITVLKSSKEFNFTVRFMCAINYLEFSILYTTVKSFLLSFYMMEIQ